MRLIKRWLKRGFILATATVCALSVPIMPAQAALVNYSFTGSIDGPAMFPVSGSFQFDNATGGSGGVYTGAVTGFTLNIGGYTSSFIPGANAVTVSQNMPLGSGIVDRWALVTAATGGAISGSNPPAMPFSFDLRLDRIGGGLFSDTSLQNPPSLGGMNNSTTGRWRLFFEDANGNPSVYLGSMTSLTAVPLPAAVLLFGAGLISLVGLGAGGLRNLRGSKA